MPDAGADDESPAAPAAAVAPDDADDEEVIIEEVEPEGKDSAKDEGEKAGGAGNDPYDEEGEVEGPQGEDSLMNRINKEKKNMSPDECLDRSAGWKAQGNEFYKRDEIFKAADAWYHAILFSRDLMSNPQYYPDLKHTEEQRQQAKDLCESLFTNLALLQYKYGCSLHDNQEERTKVLNEAAKSATEALKINAKNVKALYRRALAKHRLMQDSTQNSEAQTLGGEAKTDLMALLEVDPKNRDARAELKEVQEHLKQRKREEIASERKEFSFASTLGGLGVKEKDVLGDGSVRKLTKSAGDGGRWLNEDWLVPGAATRCVVHVRCTMLSSGGPEGREKPRVGDGAHDLSFALGDPEMHEGIGVAVRSMTVGEVATFTFAPTRLTSQGSLAKLLPDPAGEVSNWEIELQKFVTWSDLDKDGGRLQKIASEGYGAFPEDLAEVCVHWRVFGPDNALIHSSRYKLNIGAGGAGGIKNEEDDDVEAPKYVIGESCWEPLAMLCRSLRQGGVGELRLRQLPPLPKQQDNNSEAGVSAQLSAMMNKAKGGDKALRHCIVRAELERVTLALSGPDDSRWQGMASIVQERFRSEQLLNEGKEATALTRLRRAAAWSQAMMAEDPAAASKELGAARASLGWVLACGAAPILDLGNVNSRILAQAQKDLAEAEEHCAFLEENHPDHFSSKLLRAKLLVAQDDDFKGAHEKLLEAQKIAPDDKRVQEELRKVKIELRKVQEEESKAQVVKIRDNLKRARTEGPDVGREEAVLSLLRQLADVSVSWETVMESRIGVELKSCQECGEEAKRMCCEILGKLKDQSKEQRPMWDQ